MSHDRELASWNAYLETGSEREAAARLGVHVNTVKRHLDVLKDEYHVRTLAQLADKLARLVPK